MPTTQTTFWLDLLDEHPLFTLDDQEFDAWERSRSSAAQTTRTDTKLSTSQKDSSSSTRLLDTPRFSFSFDDDSVKRHVGKQACMVVRDGDLFVAINDRLRVLNLNEYKNAWVKANQDGLQLDDDYERDVSWMGEVRYKTLETPAINFPIRSLSVNPNGKLMAVVGDHDLCVVVLPRTGNTRSKAENMECRTYTMGPYYHSADASSKIVKVRWHPLSESRSHIVVLTMDGFLRMYNIAKDVDEPEQTYNFSNGRSGIPASPIGARGPSQYWAPPKRYTSDEDTLEAVSFCFGQGDGDWGTFALYCLMRNGDVYSMCPIVPVRSLVPRSLLDNLACLVSKRYDEVHQKAKENPRLYDWLRHQYRLQMRWISEALSSTVRSVVASSSDTSASFDDHSLSNTISSLYADPYSNEHHVVVTHSPTNTAVRQPLQKQGPYLFQPAPIEFGDEGDASDIYCLKTEPIGVVAIAFEDGKVDVCLEVERVEARWEVGGVDSHTILNLQQAVAPEPPRSSARRPSLHPLTPPPSSTTDLPIFTVYESIDLGFRSSPAPRASTTSFSFGATASNTSVAAAAPHPLNHPTIVADPMYTDTFYIYHRAGAHAVVMKGWLDDLTSAMEAEEEKAARAEEEALGPLQSGEDFVESFVRMGRRSDVCWVVNSGPLRSSDPTPIIGFTLINDIYLSYSILFLTSTFRFVGLELSLRTPSHITSTGLSTALLNPDGELDVDSCYTSLLPLPSFKPPDALEKFHGLPRQPRIVMQLPLDQRTKSLAINEESLRFLAKTVETFREEIRVVLGAGTEIRQRLDLQRKEQQRQLEKLASLSEKLTNSLGPQLEERVQTRLADLLQKQQGLLMKADTVLQILMEKHEPELSEFEERYFNELNKLKMTVSGERGFSVRVNKLSNQYGLLKEKAEEIMEQQQALQNQRDQQNGRMSLAQLHRVRGALSHETNLIDETKEKVESISDRMKQLRVKE